MLENISARRPFLEMALQAAGADQFFTLQNESGKLDGTEVKPLEFKQPLSLTLNHLVMLYKVSQSYGYPVFLRYTQAVIGIDAAAVEAQDWDQALIIKSEGRDITGWKEDLTAGLKKLLT